MRTSRNDNAVIVGLHLLLPGATQLYTKRVVCNDVREFQKLQEWAESEKDGPADSFHGVSFSIPANVRQHLVLVTLLSDGQE